ncbi:ComEC/Rec2 family competence protein [Puerhibacterium sp. TATVAM-FAB25]|uniref:ComEC/Rec2 family competence protein n=1 Tax=Puerhibacterium sp. TATVAM-FAB25 TaxID=3093699 RepID=UPI0039784D70
MSGAVDLRLAPAVLVAWAAAWAATGPAEPWTAAVLAAATVVACAAVLAVTARRTARRARPGARATRVVAAHVLLAAACAAAVVLSAHVQTAGRAPLARWAEQQPVAELTGRVASEAQPAAFGDGVRWTLAVERVTARGVTLAVRAPVEVTGPRPAPAYGERVAVRAQLDAADAGAAEAATARADRLARTVAPAPAVVTATTTMRTALLAATDGLSPQARGLVPGIAVGDTSRLPPDLDEAFRTTGLTHLTAVSGGHFAIVLALVTAVAGAARLPRAGRVVLVAAVAAAFVLLVRPEPSVQRAAAMCAVTLAGVALGRPAASVPSLATAATVLLLADPWLARTYGFVLSCAATAGLVLLAPPLVRRLAPWTGRPAAFALAVPLAAQAACGPVLVLLDPALATTSVLANVLAAPAVAPATLLGLAATVTAPWWPAAAGALGWLAGLATGWIAAVARWCAGLPGALLPWPGGVGGLLAMAAATVALGVLVLRRPPGEGWPVGWADRPRRVLRDAAAWSRAAGARRRAGLATRRDRTAAAGALVVVLLAVSGATTAAVRTVASGGVPPDWSLAACDVGQGDALVARSGPSSAVVVDVGPDGLAAARCLDALGVERVDLLVLSHFHADHVGGLPAVLAGREVAGALVSPRAEPAGQARRTLAALQAAGVAARVPAAGESGTAGEPGAAGSADRHVEWRVLGAGSAALGPAAAGSGGEEGDGANDASLAVALRVVAPGGAAEVVTLGDLEEAGQEALRSRLESAGQQGVAGGVLDGVDVVKVAHHGSASQSDGLAALLHPGVALVSSGADNTYGHPTERALGLFEGLGAAVVRTDRCGTAVLVLRAGGLALACR